MEQDSATAERELAGLVVARAGRVAQTSDPTLPWVVLDGAGVRIDAVDAFLKELLACGTSAASCRSYAFDLLRWFRFLAAVDVGWERASRAEVRDFVLWLRSSVNPARDRRRAGAPAPGSVNARTGKAHLRAGYAPATINHALSVLAAFYEFHRSGGSGPMVSAVPPQSRTGGRLDAHHNPLEPFRLHRRGAYRQKQPDRLPRAVPDDVIDAFAELEKQIVARIDGGEHATEALNLLTRMVIVTGKDLRRLDLTDFTTYATQRRNSGRPGTALSFAYEVLHAIGGLTGHPPTMRQARARGQLSIAEMVDRYPIACRPVRDVFVHYLTERAALLDYGSLINQAQLLVSLFWVDLEHHHPGIDSLALTDEMTQAWKQRIRVLPDGEARRGVHTVLFVVRSFYLDLIQWSLEDPSTTPDGSWKPSATPAPASSLSSTASATRAPTGNAADGRPAPSTSPGPTSRDRGSTPHVWRTTHSGPGPPSRCCAAPAPASRNSSN